MTRANTNHRTRADSAQWQARRPGGDLAGSNLSAVCILSQFRATVAD
jgi:hypothetical protein